MFHTFSLSWRQITLVLCAGFTLAACQKEHPTTLPAQSTKTLASDQGTIQPQPPTEDPSGLSAQDKQLVQESKQFFKALREGDTQAGNASFDHLALARSVIGQLPLEGLKGKVDKQQLVDHVHKGLMRRPGGILTGSYNTNITFLRLQNTPTGTEVLARLTTEDDGLDYLRFTPKRSDTGKITFVNFYKFSAGEYMATLMVRTMRAAMSQMLAAGADPDKDVDQKQAQKYAQAIGVLTKASSLVTAGQHKEALAMLDTIPDVQGAEKPIALLRITCLSSLGEAQHKEYVSTLMRYKASWPKDPSLHLLLLDFYALRMEWDNMLTSITALDQQVGGDPYLDYYRTTAFVGQGKIDESLKTTQGFLKNFPDHSNGQALMVQLLSTKGQFAEAIKQVRALEARDLNFDPALLSTEPWGRALLASPEGKAHFKTN